MRKKYYSIGGICVLVCLMVFMTLTAGQTASADSVIKIFIDGKEVVTDVDPIIINDRTMVPIRAISEGLGMDVRWDPVQRQVIISSTSVPVNSGTVIDPLDGSQVTIMGNSVASAEELKQLMLANNPYAPAELPELYIEIGKKYGMRGDIAFCQAAKETGWWKFGGLVQPYQNNYCGLGATGAAATGNEDLHGADSSRVWYEPGVHGVIFRTPADGVEAHIQHLYAYASKSSIPAGRALVDPRFTLVTRGIANVWSDLDGRWAVPGVGYGDSILNDYFAKASSQYTGSLTYLAPQSQIRQLQQENEELKQQIQQLEQMGKTRV